MTRDREEMIEREMMLSNNKAVITLLTAITRGGKWRGNPYCAEEVKAVMVQVAAERGVKDWHDALRGIEVYDNYRSE